MPEQWASIGSEHSVGRAQRTRAVRPRRDVPRGFLPRHDPTHDPRVQARQPRVGPHQRRARLRQIPRPRANDHHGGGCAHHGERSHRQDGPRGRRRRRRPRRRRLLPRPGRILRRGQGSRLRRRRHRGHQEHPRRRPGRDHQITQNRTPGPDRRGLYPPRRGQRQRGALRGERPTLRHGNHRRVQGEAVEGRHRREAAGGHRAADGQAGGGVPGGDETHGYELPRRVQRVHAHGHGVAPELQGGHQRDGQGDRRVLQRARMRIRHRRRGSRPRRSHADRAHPNRHGRPGGAHPRSRVPHLQTHITG